MIYDPTRPCPKCGYDSILTKYAMYYGQEQLMRRCQRCGYDWNEKPLDSKPDA